MNNYKNIILIDLDGVLNEYGKEPFPKIKNGAKEFIEELSKLGELYLFTSRNLILLAKWLLENKIDKYFKDITNLKIPSYLYIDDRCICFKGEYKKTIEEIRQFRVHWK